MEQTKSSPERKANGASDLAAQARRFAANTDSPEAFGRAFLRAALAEAAASIDGKGTDGSTVVLDAKVRVRFTYPPRPEPPKGVRPPRPGLGDLDICYEVCASGTREPFWACYVSCKAPAPPLDPPVDPCDTLWAQYQNGDITALGRLIQEGCVTVQRVRPLSG